MFLSVQCTMCVSFCTLYCACFFPYSVLFLYQILKQNNSRLENRTQLVQMCHMGPKVFINCAGFIKLDTNCLGDRYGWPDLQVVCITRHGHQCDSGESFGLPSSVENVFVFKYYFSGELASIYKLLSSGGDRKSESTVTVQVTRLALAHTVFPPPRMIEPEPWISQCTSLCCLVTTCSVDRSHEVEIQTSCGLAVLRSHSP